MKTISARQFLSIALTSLLLNSCAQSSNGVKVIGADELVKLQMEGVPVVDVRTTEEVKDGKIPGALNVTLSSDFVTSMQAFDKEQPVIVYCRSGRRSTVASEKLIQAGYKLVFNYTGSFNEWTAQKRPIE